MKGEKATIGTAGEGSEMDDEGRNISHYNSGEVVCPCETDHPSSLVLTSFLLSEDSPVLTSLELQSGSNILCKKVTNCTPFVPLAPMHPTMIAPEQANAIYGTAYPTQVTSHQENQPLVIISKYNNM